MSEGEACSETAFSAGCGSIVAIMVVHPLYDMPYIPTLPLLFGMFFSIHSMALYVSVLSSIDFGSFLSRVNRCISNFPSDLYRPRMSWNTNMYPSLAISAMYVFLL